MDDLISRQAAIEAINARRSVYSGMWGKGLSMAVDTLRDLPSAQATISKMEQVEDCISRQAAIDFIKDAPVWVSYTKGDWDKAKAAEDESEFVEDIIKQTKRAIMDMIQLDIPASQPEPRWIPVTERLPENNRQVLVYARSVHYALAKYDEMRQADGSYKKEWVTFDAWKPLYTIKEVIAWMPLPAPYQPDAK